MNVYRRRHPGHPNYDRSRDGPKRVAQRKSSARPETSDDEDLIHTADRTAESMEAFAKNDRATRLPKIKERDNWRRRER